MQYSNKSKFLDVSPRAWNIFINHILKGSKFYPSLTHFLLNTDKAQVRSQNHNKVGCQEEGSKERFKMRDLK